MLSTTAIFVTFNSAAVIGAALGSLPKGVPAIVVDNASTDDSALVAERRGATVIRRTQNAGFGVANNEGWQAASTPWILFLNPDARLGEGALQALLNAAEAIDDADLLVPTIRKADGTVFRKQSSRLCDGLVSPRAGLPVGVQDIGFASGAAILARRSRLAALGGFDTEIFLYFEDDDLSRRVLDAGGRILHVAAATVTHAGNTSSSPSRDLDYAKHWHRGWSERHVRTKFGQGGLGLWQSAEALAKAGLARLVSGETDFAMKHRGYLSGIRAHARGVRAQDVRDQARRIDRS